MSILANPGNVYFAIENLFLWLELSLASQGGCGPFAMRLAGSVSHLVYHTHERTHTHTQTDACVHTHTDGSEHTQTHTKVFN